jgi:CRP-like cAMP-binding protein
MQDFSSILNHIAPYITFSEEEKELFTSVLKIKKIKRKQFLEQPGYVSKNRSYVVNGALRAFFIGTDGQEHTIALAIEDRWIGDPGSFMLQEPATLFIEAIEDSTLIQLSYDSEKMLLKKVPLCKLTNGKLSTDCGDTATTYYIACKPFSGGTL